MMTMLSPRFMEAMGVSSRWVQFCPERSKTVCAVLVGATIAAYWQREPGYGS